MNVKMNEFIINQIIPNILGGLLASAIIWIGAKVLMPFLKNQAAGKKSQLLLFSGLFFIVTPIFLFNTVYFFTQPHIYYLLFFVSITFAIGFIILFFAFENFIKERDLYSFINETRKKKNTKILDQELKNCIIIMRKAIHEIELEFDRNFKRAQCTDSLKQMEINLPDNPIPLKRTTMLEGEIYEIYLRYIPLTGFGKHIYSDSQRNKEIISEPEEGIKYRWILDPIDGGYHFVRNIPLFTTCFALQKKEAKGGWDTIFSAIYIPVTKEFFFALKGGGAYLNTWENRLPLVDKRDHVLAKSLFYLEFPNKATFANDEANNMIGKGTYRAACDFLSLIFSKVEKTRGFNLGSFGLSYLAKGSFDAYISLSNGTSYYDIAAGKLLVEESGNMGHSSSNGIVITEYIDNKHDVIEQGVRVFATSERIYKELLKDKEIVESLTKLFPHLKQSKRSK